MRRTTLTTSVLIFSVAIWFAACRTTPPSVSLPAVGQGIASWGDNRSGQLGDGSTVPKRASWGAVNLDGPWNAVAAACAIQVTFKPGSAGSRTATLFINNDSPGGNLQVALSGSGTP
jgi:hypothetical protein